MQASQVSRTGPLNWRDPLCLQERREEDDEIFKKAHNEGGKFLSVNATLRSNSLRLSCGGSHSKDIKGRGGKGLSSSMRPH